MKLIESSVKILSKDVKDIDTIVEFVTVKTREKEVNEMYKLIEIAGRTCYDENTEVLTDYGWKYIKDITNDVKVLSYDPTTNAIVWDTPNIMSNEINDNMVEINHNNIRLKVTKDHRIYQSVPEKREYSFLKASQLCGLEKIPNSKQNRFRLPKFFIGSKRDLKDIRIPILTHSKWINQGGSPSHNDILKTVNIPCNEDFMVIAGAFISEGHTNHRSKYGSGDTCQITQDENSVLYKDVIQALDNLNWKYRIDKDPRKPNIKWIVFGTNQCFTEYFDILFGKGSKNKKLPDWFRYLPDSYLEILLKYLYLGDGSHSKTRKERYLSISKKLLDQIQQIYILLGKNANYTFDENVSQKCSLEECTRDSWIIHRNKHIVITEPKKQTVYCTQTKSGIICVRYNNKTCWCGNCYKSEDKITDDSAKAFVDRMIALGHAAMLEHGTVYLTYNHDIEAPDVSMSYKYQGNRYSKVMSSCDEHGWLITSYVTTNLRVLVEHGWMDDLQYITPPTVFHGKRTTVKFTCDRGVSHEFVRHRIFSFAQESSRYCNYSKDKFGNELTFIKPTWYTNEVHSIEAKTAFEEMLQVCETFYLDLVKDYNMQAQEARAILPNATKTELVMTGFDSDWEGFFELRCAGSAHPDARKLANELKLQMYGEC